jgi:hypothetical protein
MKTTQSKAEIYLMALESLSAADKKKIIAHLLEDEELREDILDVALIQQRKGEPARPFNQFLAEKEEAR